MLRMSLAGPQRCGQLTIFPLVAASDVHLPYDTLESAVTSGTLTVQEKVGEPGLLLAANSSPRPVLILNGEQPMGLHHPFLASQSMLLAPEDVTEIPVSPMRFMHSGPPGFRSPDAPGPDSHDPGDARHQVSPVEGPDGLARPDSPDAIPAPGLERAFTIVERQVGLLAFSGPWFLGLDALGAQNLYAPLHSRILEGYLMAARAHGEVPESHGPVGEGEASAVLALMERAERTPCGAVGVGQYSMFGGPIRGGELFHDDHLVHLSVFPVTEWAPTGKHPH